jgi:hypothetical protein
VDTQILNNADSSQINLTQKRLLHESRIRNGTNWFYWIGGLSILNTLVYFFGGSFTFVIGLGATQFVDGFMYALAKDLGEGYDSVRFIGLAIDFVIAGIFLLFGFLGRKRRLWPVIVGIVLYALDGVLLLAFQDFIGAGFHVIALLSIAKSIKSINELAIMEKYGGGQPGERLIPQISSLNSGGSMIPQIGAAKPVGSIFSPISSPQNMQTNQKEVKSNWIMAAMVILIVLLLFVIGLLLIQ